MATPDPTEEKAHMDEETQSQSASAPSAESDGSRRPRRPWVPPRLGRPADQLDDVASNKTSVHEQLGTATTLTS